MILEFGVYKNQKVYSLFRQLKFDLLELGGILRFSTLFLGLTPNSDTLTMKIYISHKLL